MSRFPAAFRLPAFRFSVIRFPPGDWALLAVGLPDLGPDLDGVTAFRTHELRPGWVPPLPRGRRCSSRPSRFLDRRLPLYRGQSLYPAPASHLAGLRLTRHQREFTQFTRPIFPSPVASRMEREPSGFPPRASHPADQEPTTHAEAGTGHRARTWNYTLNITSVDLQSCSSLTTCDLASHIEKQQSRAWRLSIFWACPIRCWSWLAQGGQESANLCVGGLVGVDRSAVCAPARFWAQNRAGCRDAGRRSYGFGRSGRRWRATTARSVDGWIGCADRA